jgi:hypothetical protein
MVRTDPGSLSTASVARTHRGGNNPRPVPHLRLIARAALGRGGAEGDRPGDGRMFRGVCGGLSSAPITGHWRAGGREAMLGS